VAQRQPFAYIQDMSLLRRLFSTQTNAAPEAFTAPLAPEEPFYVVGDIHGGEYLLARLLSKIEQDEPDTTQTIVCVGDYVDRGEASAAVLRWLFMLSTDPELTLICLMGNHEDMMIKFIDEPAKRGPRWLRYGGLQTLASIGIGGVSESSNANALTKARDELVAALGDDLIDWLKNLPSVWQSGNVAVVHAGADPSVPIDKQERRDLIWGHRDFRHLIRRDGVWVVHGHTIVEHANATDGRIAVDTGAYATGRLTAAHISSQGVRFIET